MGIIKFTKEYIKRLFFNLFCIRNINQTAYNNRASLTQLRNDSPLFRSHAIKLSDNVVYAPCAKSYKNKLRVSFASMQLILWGLILSIFYIRPWPINSHDLFVLSYLFYPFSFLFNLYMRPPFSYFFLSMIRKKA